VDSTVHAKESVAQRRASFGPVVLEQTIRETIRLAEAPALRMPITRYAPWSPAAQDYRAVAAEILARMGGTTSL
jgi:chromosome partitioning protein